MCNPLDPTNRAETVALSFCCAILQNNTTYCPAPITPSPGHPQRDPASGAASTWCAWGRPLVAAGSSAGRFQRQPLPPLAGSQQKQPGSVPRRRLPACPTRSCMRGYPLEPAPPINTSLPVSLRGVASYDNNVPCKPLDGAVLSRLAPWLYVAYFW